MTIVCPPGANADGQAVSGPKRRTPQPPQYRCGLPLNIAKVIAIGVPASPWCEVVTAKMTSRPRAAVQRQQQPELPLVNLSAILVDTKVIQMNARQPTEPAQAALPRPKRVRKNAAVFTASD
nr:DUF2790 domain-containing protein [Pseudomonas oleovorans]